MRTLALSAARARRAMAAAAAGAASAALLVSSADPDAGTGSLGLGSVDSGPALSLDHVLAAAGGLALLALAWGLWRGKRRALDIAVACLVAAAAVRIATDEAPMQTAIELGLALLLVSGRGAFVRGGRPGAGRRTGVAAIAASGATYAVAVVAVLASDRTVGPGPTLQAAAGWLAGGAWWMSSGWLGIVASVLAAIALLAAGASLWARLRPAPAATGHTPGEHDRAAEIVNRFGADSLDPFALREDKSFHFAHGGLVAYRTLRGVTIVSGDPIGPPGSAGAILASFQRFAARHGWDTVVTAASAHHLEQYRALGYRALQIGNEAVVDPGAFSLEGRAIRKVRQSVTRMQRRGWGVEVVEGDELGPELGRQLSGLEDEWRRRQPRLQGFAMTLGRLWGAREDAHSLFVLARDPDGDLRAFLRFARYPSGLSLDVMRRSGGEPNGLNEALVVAALEYARQRGMSEVSLNFAGFAHIMGPGGPDGAGHRLARWAMNRAHGRFQLERLVRFNDKFDPEWRPRYLLHRGVVGLPLVALRVLQAEAYVRPPRARELPACWRPAASPVP